MKKNNKGFTLIELLAVIVVLAIIMVIATTQINRTIRKSRVDSFLSTMQIAMEASRTCSVQQESGDDCVANVDYSEDDYTLTMTSTDYTTYTITLSAKDGSEFESINVAEFYGNDDGTTIDQDKVKAQLGHSSKTDNVTFTQGDPDADSDPTYPTLKVTYRP